MALAALALISSHQHLFGSIGMAYQRNVKAWRSGSMA